MEVNEMGSHVDATEAGSSFQLGGFLFTKTKIAVAAAALVAVMFAVLVPFGSVSADHDPNPHPAQNATQCANAGGVFSQPDGPSGINICTVTVAGSTATVPASHPSGEWTADVTTPDTIHTYTILGGTRTHTTTGGGDPVVTACYNSQGNLVGGFANNPNCLPLVF